MVCTTPVSPSSHEQKVYSPDSCGREDGGDVPTYRYRIVIVGGLGMLAREAFEDFDIEFSGGETALTADLDEAALYGALNRVQSLRLELVALSRLPQGKH
jgi:hypothetical protein